MDDPIDVSLGLDVNASRRLIKRKILGSWSRPLAMAVLLIAAAEVTQRCLGGGGFDGEPTDKMLGSVLFFAA